jgi:hypothetical protein
MRFRHRHWVDVLYGFQEMQAMATLGDTYRLATYAASGLSTTWSRVPTTAGLPVSEADI